jgi:hypothetical protein
VPERTLTVRLIGDDRDLQRAFAQSGRRAQTFQGQVAGVGVGVSRSFIAAGVAAGATAVSFQAVATALGASITASTDLNEQISRTRVILGDAADQMLEWSETTATGLGISQREALAAAATFAGLFQTVGVGAQQAGFLSREIVRLAADLASLQNTSPEEALTALRSGLVGESEPLRRFNIFLSETAVAQEAMAATGKDTAKALTDQDKALARYSIILRQSLPAQGNFNDTSKEFANQQRILRANLDNLSTDIGSVLIPVLSDLTTAALAAFDALNKLGSVDLPDFPGLDFDISGAGGATLLPGGPLGPLAAFVAEITKQEEEAEKQIEALGPGGGIGQDIARREEERAREIEAGQRRAKRAQDRQRRAFDAFVKGMGLKLDRAQLTEPLDDDIAALRELERAILRQIEREGRTFKLVDQLTQIRLQIQSLIAQRADDAAQEARDAFAQVLDALDLRLERAQVTASFEDDLRVLQEMERVITQRIAAEGKTLELERELFDVRQQQAEVRRQQAERQREARQGRQFEALNLTAEGEERVPSTDALQRRLRSLREQLKGTVLDTQETRSQLQRIARVLSGDFGAVGRDVRQAILEMFQEISGALDEGGKRGPLTRTTSLNTKKFLEGLGLSPEEVRALRGRLSNLNSAGVGFAFGTPSTVPTSGFGGGLGKALIVEAHTTVNLDGQKVASVVTRSQQRTDRSNPRQKRGPNRKR